MEMIAPVSSEEIGFINKQNVESLRKERLIRKLPVIDFKIFNRWGELIFESTDYNKAWLGDANSNGYYNQMDAYVWSLEVKGRELEVENYNGVVTILR
jgi:hypothetical protein